MNRKQLETKAAATFLFFDRYPAERQKRFARFKREILEPLGSSLLEEITQHESPEDVQSIKKTLRLFNGHVISYT